tara:strand:+ start:29648 stop:30007 length:360 start_codon:yes stop_codon:yes gene_type:complete
MKIKENVVISKWRKLTTAKSRRYEFSAPFGNQFSNGVGFDVTEYDMNDDGTWFRNTLSVHFNHRYTEAFCPTVTNFLNRKNGADFVNVQLSANTDFFFTPEQFEQLQEVIGRHDPRQVD